MIENEYIIDDNWVCPNCKKLRWLDDIYCTCGFDRNSEQGKKHNISDKDLDSILKEYHLREYKGSGSVRGDDDKKSVENSTISSKNRNYPALIFLSKFANFIAWLGVISSLVGYFIYIDSLYRPELGEVLFPLFAIILATFILFVFWRAISEILILFVDIAKDVREIRLKK
ncbi:DUF4282 domain-containing protein [Candidatus Marinimicrobia bacterium]|nr:DUF4282 domain-containing protein [Candidatus Neomarinimicrobiota bacterium]